MDDLIKLVRTYQQSDVEDDRVGIAEQIFREVEPKLRFYVFSFVRPSSGDYVLQEALIAITRSLKNFTGSTDQAFLSWCKGVAWNKIKDQYDKQFSGNSGACYTALRLSQRPHLEQRLQ